jgi:hypothetical protein
MYMCVHIYMSRNVDSFTLGSKNEQRVARRMSRGTSTRPEIQRLLSANAEAKLQLTLVRCYTHD